MNMADEVPDFSSAIANDIGNAGHNALLANMKTTMHEQLFIEESIRYGDYGSQSVINLVNDSIVSFETSEDVEIVGVYKISSNKTSKTALNLTENNKRKGKVTQNSSCSKAKSIGECPVCIESLHSKEIMSTICGHVFCEICIQNVIRQSKCCPICRKPLTLKTIHPIYL